MAMEYMDKREYRLTLIDMLRGAILVQCRILYPSACFQSHLAKLAEGGGLSNDDFNLAIAWLRERGWIRTECRHILGREDVAVTLTAAGIDVATQIDPQTPIVPRAYRND